MLQSQTQTQTQIQTQLRLQQMADVHDRLMQCMMAMEISEENVIDELTIQLVVLGTFFRKNPNSPLCPLVIGDVLLFIATRPHELSAGLAHSCPDAFAPVILLLATNTIKHEQIVECIPASNDDTPFDTGSIQGTMNALATGNTGVANMHREFEQDPQKRAVLQFHYKTDTYSEDDDKLVITNTNHHEGTPKSFPTKAFNKGLWRIQTTAKYLYDNDERIPHAKHEDANALPTLLNTAIDKIKEMFTKNNKDNNGKIVALEPEMVASSAMAIKNGYRGFK